MSVRYQKIARVFATVVLLFTWVSGLVPGALQEPVRAAATCSSNPSFPLTLSAQSSACLGKVDNNLYSFEFTSFVAQQYNFNGISVTGNSLAAGSSYTMKAVGAGDTGTVYVSQVSGKDTYGDPVSILVKANPTCTDTITLSGVDQFSNTTITATANPCDLVSKFKADGTDSFSIPFGNGAIGYGQCASDPQFPMVLSTNTKACLGMVDKTQFSLEFLVNVTGITSPHITIAGGGLNPPADPKKHQYLFSDLGNNNFVSQASGNDVAGDTVGVLIAASQCNSIEELTITASSPQGQQGSIVLDTCELLRVVQTCNDYSFAVNVKGGSTDIFDFASYTCGGGFTGSDCSHPTATKFDPYIQSQYNPKECLGRLADNSGTALPSGLGGQSNPGLISAEFVVTVANAGPNDVIDVSAGGDNVSGRLTDCVANQKLCDGLSNQQLADMQEPFEKIKQYLYHSAPVPTISFPALYNGNCNLLDQSGCNVPPDPNKFPAYSGTGIFSDTQCDPNATVTISAFVPSTGYSGSTLVNVCDIIKSHYSIAVKVYLNAPVAACSSGDNYASIGAYVFCPLLPYLLDMITYLTNAFIIPITGSSL